MGDTVIRIDFEGTVWAQIGIEDKLLFQQAACRLNEIANDICIKNPTSDQAWDEASRFARMSSALRGVYRV